MKTYTQPDLFTRAGQSIVPPTPEEVAKARRSQPAIAKSETSRAAAARIAPVAGTLRWNVYEYIRQSGLYGATDEEIQVALCMEPSTQRPRRVELVDGGFVVKAAFTRKTISGRAASVWVAARQ